MTAFLVIYLIALSLFAQTERSLNDRELTEVTLKNVLQWEILWSAYPKGFRLQNGGSLSVILHVNSRGVSYCSHDAGVCVLYRAEGIRNWLAERESTCPDNAKDEDCLTRFLGIPVKRTADSYMSRSKLGNGGLAGIPESGSGLTWKSRIQLDTSKQIVDGYRQDFDKSSLRSLHRWLTTGLAEADQRSRSIVIACLKNSDPNSFYYIDGNGSRTVFAVFWDYEERNWRVAYSVERVNNPNGFDQLIATIDSIPCDRIKPAR